ncbi:MAG: hypothetical protein ABH871_06540 [Pseudomonadota bacterium]
MKGLAARLSVILAFFLICSCGSGGGGEPERSYVNIIPPLDFSSQLNTVTGGLGSGTYHDSVSFNLNAAIGIMDMVNGFFTYINGANIPDGPLPQNEVSTGYGDLKADFGSITTVQADINMDGTEETITCSKTASATPICAWFWLNSTRLAQMVIVTEATDSSVGSGALTFTPSMIGLATNSSQVATVWNDTSSEAVRGYFVGEATSTVNADKAYFSIVRDVSLGDVELLMKESGVWNATPIDACTSTQGIFGWVDGTNYMSARFNPTGTCDVPTTGGPCVEVSSANEADLATRCAVDITSEDYVSTDFSASNADFPSDFPASPTF